MKNSFRFITFLSIHFHYYCQLKKLYHYRKISAENTASGFNLNKIWD